MQEKEKMYTRIRIIILMLAGIGLNCAGKFIALYLQLPFWLDTIGTSIVACVLGPVYGAFCGGISNIVYGFRLPITYVYCITNVVIGLMIGISYKKGQFQTLFRAITVSVSVAVMATIISTPLNLILKNGLMGNAWGDGLYSMLKSYEWNNIIAAALGELFVDFPDKILTILITYFMINIPLVSGKKKQKQEKKTQKQKKKTQTATACMVILILVSTSRMPAVALADTTESSNSSQDDFSPLLYAQTIYNSETGLTVGEANAIVETSDGYIWIGTYAGLYRYDGRNFTLMNFDSVKNVNRLFVDKKGRLWIGTNDKGVSIYENGEITEVIDKKSGLASNSIRSIAEDERGNYYIGTSATLCIITDRDGIKIEKKISDIVYADAVAVGPDGQAAIVTNSGELFLVKEQQILGRYTSTEDGVDYSSCLFDSIGNLYVATSSNIIYRWDKETQTLDQTSAIKTSKLGYIHTMHQVDDDIVWICGDNGIGYVKDHSFTYVDTGAFNSSIDTMMEDYQGNLWFTSSRFGVLKLTKNSFVDLFDQCHITDRVVNAVTIWQEELYAGTDAGLAIIDLATHTELTNDLTQMLSEDRIRCLYVDSKNHLWISTSSGAGLIEVSASGEITTYGMKQGTIGERFRSTIELTDGTMVAAENTGIDFIQYGVVVATLGETDGLTNPQILSLVQKDDETIYAGSDGNGIMVIKNKKVVDRITEEDGLPSGVILRMVPVEDGFLVVTSNSLCYLDKDKHITELKQFPYSNNFDVIPSNDGNLWVLGSAGIYIVNKEDLLNGNLVKYELLDSRKGLQTSLTANSWNYVDGDTLYFSGNSGAYRIDMNNYMEYTGSYRMMLDYVDNDNNSYAMTEEKETVIPNDRTRITIRPELLNYTLNDPYISYYLEGIDEKEYVVQQSYLEDISYTNLPAGDYVFHLSILDHRGNLAVENHTYTIKIQPQFWEHTWFLAYLIFVCALVVAYVTWTIAVIRTNKIIEKQKQEIEIAKKQAEMGNETIIAIAKTVDAKDVRTSEHSERVSEYSVLIAKRLGWNEEQCENLKKIALLHDIGKIGIPDAILNKPSGLTKEEYAIMKSHVVIGSKILKDFTVVENVQDGVKYHHEKYDGTGYVEGLKGDQIPMDARIICLADSFDAMNANRVYRQHMDMDYVVNEIKKGSGTQFDPQLVQIMLELIEDGSIKVDRE